MNNAKYGSIEDAARAMKMDNSHAQAGYGAIGTQATMDSACRTPLRDRIYGQMEESNLHARKLDRLSELASLLERNPEVARILDLLEEVRG